MPIEPATTESLRLAFFEGETLRLMMWDATRVSTSKFNDQEVRDLALDTIRAIRAELTMRGVA
jgi:hypothetical protein